MADRVWLQRLFINGNLITQDAIISSAYIECADTSGPLITLQLRDSLSVIRDDFGLKGGSLIEAEFSDVLADKPVNFKERFIAGLPKIDGEAITVDAFSEACHKLKQPATKPRFFVNKTPAFILSQCLPGLPVETDYSEPGTYHLNVGMNPSSLLFSMARDYGAAVYVSRGKVYFKSLKKLFTAAPVTKIIRNSPDKGLNVATSRALDNKAVYDRQLRRQFHCVDEFGKMHNSRSNADSPSIVLASIPPARLENQALHLLPVLDIESLGVGTLQPGQLVETDIVKFSDTAERDQSIATRLVITRLCHYSEGMRYINRIVFGVLNGN